MFFAKKKRYKVIQYDVFIGYEVVKNNGFKSFLSMM